jgi:hypothetical protein
MRVDRIGTVLFAGALVAAGFWGCGGDGATGSGGGGGTGGTGGVNTTTTTSTNMTTTSTTTPATTTTTNGGESSFLGLECAKDGDCGMDGKCVQVTDNDAILGGGPAGGYCSKPCQDDAECPGKGSSCLLNDKGVGECFLGCTFGDPALMFLNDPLDPAKCHGREDLRCQELQNGSQVCLPTCGSDSQCDGRVCDPRLALCVDTPSVGKAIGEVCDPMAMVEECAGSCIGIQGGKAMCTSPCVMAGEIETSFDCGGVDKGICLYSPSGTGAGDLGFCAESCTVQDQCQTPNFFCFNINVMSNGVCLDTKKCDTNTDCDFLDGECTETTLGKFCLSPGYPLGKLDPNVATGSSSSGSGGAGGMASGSSSGSGGMGGMGGMASGSSSSGM